MFTRITLLLFLSCNLAFAQDLAVSTDKEAALCRTAGFQSGGGVVYATATGGVGSYTYSWTNLTTGATHIYSVWGGLNPGDYEVEVTDEAGNFASATIALDSVNPVSSFEVLTDEITWTGSEYAGTAPIAVDFQSTSINLVSPADPLSDADLVWQFRIEPGIESDPVISTDLEEIMTNYYEDGGTFDVCLSIYNRNSCSDTACATFGLLESTIGLDANAINGSYIIYPSPTTQQLKIMVDAPFDKLNMCIYGLDGKEVCTVALANGVNQIPFNVGNGIYVYRFYDVAENKVLKEGKFSF